MDMNMDKKKKMALISIGLIVVIAVAFGAYYLANKDVPTTGKKEPEKKEDKKDPDKKDPDKKDEVAKEEDKKEEDKKEEDKKDEVAKEDKKPGNNNSAIKPNKPGKYPIRPSVPGRDPIVADKEPDKEPGKEPDKEPGKEPDKEPGKEPDKEPDKEPEDTESFKIYVRQMSIGSVTTVKLNEKYKDKYNMFQVFKNDEAISEIRSISDENGSAVYPGLTAGEKITVHFFDNNGKLITTGEAQLIAA
ncbi:MAG: hypothetical protein RSB70_02190 [Clostridium sp.]